MVRAYIYGGDAKKKEELTPGDNLNMKILEEAVLLLLNKKNFINLGDGINPNIFTIRIPTDQIKYLRLSDCSPMFYQFFKHVYFEAYKSKEMVQETIVRRRKFTIYIYTHKY